jgi:hypothetical protein
MDAQFTPVRSDDAPATTLTRRSVLRGTAMVAGVTAFGLPTVAGSAFAQELRGCGKVDVFCAIDTSGSLNGTELSNLQAGVNAFVTAIDDSGIDATVGTLEFGNDGIRNKNPLQAPGGLTVSIGSAGGNTPMAPALDLADQSLYTDPAARADARKLLVLFTDGGPNYSATQYGVAALVAPRDDTTDWSTQSGDTPATYHESGTAATGNDGRQVTVGEMDETALVAASVKDATIGDGATRIVTVYVGDDGEDQQAMGTDAMTKYTDLPTYLAEYVASPDSAIDVDVANVQGVVDELVTQLETDCCVDCTDLSQKYEWVGIEDGQDPIEGFVVEDGSESAALTLVSVTLDEDGEPQQACFETTLCGLAYAVKAGRDTELHTVNTENGGGFCVTGIDADDKDVTYAISNVRFACDASALSTDRPGEGRGRPDANARGRGR